MIQRPKRLHPRRCEGLRQLDENLMPFSAAWRFQLMLISRYQTRHFHERRRDLPKIKQTLVVTVPKAYLQ